MNKTKTSKKHKVLNLKSLKTYKPFNSKELSDAKLVSETLIDCLRSGDAESFRQVLTSHFMTVNKTKFALKTGLGRRTLYALIDPKKEFNPEFTTLSALFKAIG